MDINFGNLGACTPMQILNLNYAINNMAIIDVYGTSCKYCKDDLKYSYSVSTTLVIGPGTFILRKKSVFNPSVASRASIKVI